VAAIIEIAGYDDDSGHCGDAVYDSSTTPMAMAGHIIDRLKIKVEGSVTGPGGGGE
jgi:hypothetical protein